MLALDGGALLWHPPAPTPPGNCGTHSIGGWVRHRASLDVFGEKKNLLSQQQIEPHIIQPIAPSLYHLH